MTTHILHYGCLPDRDCTSLSPLPKFGKADQVELRVRSEGCREQTYILPPSAVAAVETLLLHLLSGERVAVLAQDEEVSVQEVADILGILVHLITHRMHIGDLPFSTSSDGEARIMLKDVLKLRERIEAGRIAMEALADDAEDLSIRYGV